MRVEVDFALAACLAYEELDREVVVEEEVVRVAFGDGFFEIVDLISC